MYALTIGHLPTRFEQRAIRMPSPEHVFKFLDWNTKELLMKSLPEDFVNINPSIFMGKRTQYRQKIAKYR